jgi:regulatory protein
MTDGSSFFVSSDFADSLEIEPGDELSEKQIAAISWHAEELRAREKAFELLGRRDHSRFELARKLKERKFDSQTIASVLDRLTGAGYLDDRRFAELWVRARLRRRPEGYMRLAAGLARKGVDRRLAESVLGEVYTDEVSEMALTRAIEKISIGKDIDDTTLLKKLTARGFTYRQIKAHLQKLH